LGVVDPMGVRAIAVADPVVTVLVVLGTINHCLPDTAAWATTAAADFAVVAVVSVLKRHAAPAVRALPRPAYGFEFGRNGRSGME
jgi:hypothetical protein